MSTTNQSYGFGPAGGAVAVGAVASSVFDDQSTNTTTTTNTDSRSSAVGIGGGNYAAAIDVGPGSSGTTITSTTTDFGAIASATGIAETALAANAQGFSLLTQLTGKALNEATLAVKSAAKPFSQTAGKYASIIIGLILTAIVISLFFIFGGKRRRND